MMRLSPELDRLIRIGFYILWHLVSMTGPLTPSVGNKRKGPNTQSVRAW